MPDLICGFEIAPHATGGFLLIDRDTFNNWGTIGEARPFRDRAAAESHAIDCDRFKRGRTMTLVRKD